ncbi:MAG TPA: hypothetical protein ENJ95_03525 [Bacteroidetes bacterium]|nr:hypothetical protein [Bacteroidota bacterium]
MISKIFFFLKAADRLVIAFLAEVGRTVCTCQRRQAHASATPQGLPNAVMFLAALASTHLPVL